MASNARERAGGVVRHSDNEIPAGAAGAIDVDLKDRAETREAPKPRPVEFGWDFPFDSPKPKR